MTFVTILLYVIVTILLSKSGLRIPVQSESGQARQTLIEGETCRVSVGQCQSLEMKVARPFDRATIPSPEGPCA